MAISNSSSKSRKKVKKAISAGKAYVKATFNNTLVYITDLEGNALSWATSGENFKGSKKSTPYAAQQAATKAAQNARDTYSMKSVDIYVKGPGPGRDAAARAVSACFDKVTSLSDITGIPHNGVRAEKERRV